MYHRINLFTYLLAPSLAAIFFVMPIVITRYASATTKNCIRFRQYFKNTKFKKVDRMMLKSFPPIISLRLGLYGLITS